MGASDEDSAVPPGLILLDLVPGAEAPGYFSDVPSGQRRAVPY
jgi:hypothetical protein